LLLRTKSSAKLTYKLSVISFPLCVSELPRPEGQGFQRLAGAFRLKPHFLVRGLTAPSITMRAMFMFAFCKKAFLTFLAILAILALNGKVLSYKILNITDLKS
jgi:hypothetical protein